MFRHLLQEQLQYQYRIWSQKIFFEEFQMCTFLIHLSATIELCYRQKIFCKKIKV